jgi:leader peptidase (prepilin peptidase)/N-methyltransferase
MGLGDAKLLAMIGAFQGPAGVLFALVAGSVQGLVATTLSRVTGWKLGPDPSLLEDDEEEGTATTTREVEKPDDNDVATDPGFMRTVIPFGPFLALGALEYLLGMEDWARLAFETLTTP